MNKQEYLESIYTLREKFNQQQHLLNAKYVGLPYNVVYSNYYYKINNCGWDIDLHVVGNNINFKELLDYFLPYAIDCEYDDNFRIEYSTLTQRDIEEDDLTINNVPVSVDLIEQLRACNSFDDVYLLLGSPVSSETPYAFFMVVAYMTMFRKDLANDFNQLTNNASRAGVSTVFDFNAIVGDFYDESEYYEDSRCW